MQTEDTQQSTIIIKIWNNHLKLKLHLNDKIFNMKCECQIYKSGALTREQDKYTVSSHIIECFIGLQFTMSFKPIFKCF